MTTMKRKRKGMRRKILVDPEFQMQFTLRFGMILIAYFMVFLILTVLLPFAPELLRGASADARPARVLLHRKSGQSVLRRHRGKRHFNGYHAEMSNDDRRRTTTQH